MARRKRIRRILEWKSEQGEVFKVFGWTRCPAIPIFLHGEISQWWRAIAGISKAAEMNDKIVLHHVVPVNETGRHSFDHAASCYCEPEIQLVCRGCLVIGRVVLHQQLRGKVKGVRAGMKRG